MGMAQRKSTGTEPLARDDLVRAALRVLEREGLDGLSMRRVADELGVRAASLYWHVHNKEELVDLVADALVAGFRPPRHTGDWRRQLTTYARAYRRYLLGRRDAARVIGGRFVLGPGLLRVMESGITGLLRNGFPERTAAMAGYLVNTFVVGFVLQESVPMNAPEALGASPEQAMAAVRAQIGALSAEEYPTVVALADALVQPSMDERFDFALNVLVDGLAGLRDR